MATAVIKLPQMKFYRFFFKQINVAETCVLTRNLKQILGAAARSHKYLMICPGQQLMTN